MLLLLVKYLNPLFQIGVEMVLPKLISLNTIMLLELTTLKAGYLLTYHLAIGPHIIEDLLAADERVLKDPVATIAVAKLGDSSVEFVVRPWVNSADYWPVKFDFTKAVKEKFDSEGISIPYPQSDVHVFQEKSS